MNPDNKTIPIYRVSIHKGIRIETVIDVKSEKTITETDEFAMKVQRIKDHADRRSNKIQSS